MSHTPKYIQICDEIRGKILSGEYAIDEQIPTESSFQDLCNVSRHTVRHAISLLVQDGYLRSEKGSGTYVSNEYTQKLSTDNNQKKIGIITTYFSDYIFPSIIRGVEPVISAEGYSLTIASTENKFRLEKQSLENMFLAGVDGLIVEPTQSSSLNPNLSYYMQLKELDIPLLMINAFYEELETPCLRIDDELAGYKATNYLIAKGHTDIGVISKTDDIQGKYRLRGYLKSISEHRLNYKPDLTLYYDTATKESLQLRITEYLFENREKLTAVVCYNDEVALIVISACWNIGIKIPEELSIIGTDNAKLMGTMGVNLTTLTHPQEKLGEDAARWIINKIKNKKADNRLPLYDPELIEGDSVKIIRK
ncbi:MAG: GntR family transcriptional regulator [Clostridiales Family XIII bacterium]|jgi:GntR family transcriptional regulator of arabinose operon|nr:GntR family transcriptional regulator [Clostridiales Family XIII bacterium]